MTGVDELQKKYPTIPRQVLVKAEALTRGIRDSDLLYKLGHWDRSGGSGVYQNWDHGMSLKELAGKRPTAAAKPGYMRRLDCFYMKGGWGVTIKRDPTSPYEIREPESGKYAVFEGEEKVEDIYFPRSMPWPYRDREEPLTSTGRPITSVVTVRSPGCPRILPVRHCEYFSTGEQCKFCNFDAGHDDARSVGGLARVTNPQEEIAEAYKIFTSDVRIVHTSLIGGAFSNIDKEVRMYCELVEKIAGAVSYDPSLNLTAQPPGSRRDMQRFKDSGVDIFSFDIEVWDPQLFVEICPGKAKYVGYERYQEAYLEAVDVLGVGNVHGVMVSGATLLLANGHKTWQESRDVLIEGIRWMVKNGVAPACIPAGWTAGSEFSKDPSSRDRMPPTEHHLDVLLAQHAAMKEHGLYERMSRLGAACTLCCNPLQLSYDLGINELTGGNVGQWLAPLIPDEANWLARIVESIEESESVNETPAKAK